MDEERIKTLVKEAIDARMKPLEDKMEPFLEVLEASRIIAKAIGYIGGVLIGIGAIYTAVRQFLHV